MLKLTKARQQYAQTFIKTQARPLEKALYGYHFQEGTKKAVFAELAKFQNTDGGFGNALEPDLRLKDSSVIATSTALQVLIDLEAGEDHPLVKAAMAYLLDTYHAEAKAWPIAPPNTQDAPCAPWWDDPAGFNWHSNPRPSIISTFFDYSGLVPADLRDELTEAVVATLETLTDEIEMHELYCYLQLLEVKTLPENLRGRMLQKLEPAVKQAVSTDPATWEGYGLQPLSIVNRPDARFAGSFTAAIEQNLDFLINKQDESGAWWPSWSWGDRFPTAWEVSKLQWAGFITLGNLKVLRSFGRLE
jgi:hypothetical protein